MIVVLFFCFVLCLLIFSKIVCLLLSSGMLFKCVVLFWMNSNGICLGIDCSSGKMFFSEYCLIVIINNCCFDNFLVFVIIVVCICIFFNLELFFKERFFWFNKLFCFFFCVKRVSLDVLVKFVVYKSFIVFVLIIFIFSWFVI